MAIDQKTRKLAKIIVDYSIAVKPNENVIISASSEANDFITALYEEIILKGANPILRLGLPGLSSFFFKHATKKQLTDFPKIFDYTIKNSQKYIGIDSEYNTKEFSSVDPQKLALRNKATRKITNYINNREDKIGGCSVGYPCAALAQEAEMSISDYEDFVFNACLQDWQKISKDLNKLLAKFKKGKKVQLIGKNVDLKFEINGKQAQIDDGKDNMPGGEIFMAPIRNTMEGNILFDYPAIESGKEVTDIYLEFKKGKVIKVTASKNENFLKTMLNIDSNASRVGEFGIGANPKITRFTKNLLFDEKIIGTIHLALGMAYAKNGGGNNSSIHWDIVKDMREAKIILDNKVIQQKGRWKI